MNQKQYVLALDSGTTSSRAILFDADGGVVAVAQREFAQGFPRPGWVEHDAEEIFATQLAVAREVVARVDVSQIAAIGIANQRETTVVWDRETGKPVCPAIVWQCRRTADFCDELRGRGLSDFFRERTGLLPDAYFSGTKLRWILENVPGARRAAESGRLLFGTIDTWLAWNLTDGKAFVTDVSNASRTLMFNIRRRTWDADLLAILDVPQGMLPEVRPSSAVYGETAAGLFGRPIPIGGMAGDQQSALFGQLCLSPGEAKNTYGTGCFLLMNTGETPVFSRNGLLTTVAWGLGDRITYALEGSVFTAGSAIQWLRDQLGVLSSAAESESLAKSVPDTNGCVVVPAFTGLGAPYWDPYARGAVLGLTRGVTRAHIVRATLESLAYQVADVLAAMGSDASARLNVLKVDGGAAANGFLLQFQSDVTGVPVERPASVETTALGAAMLAGLAVGFWENLESLRSLRRVSCRFLPAWNDEKRSESLVKWHEAVGCVQTRR